MDSKDNEGWERLLEAKHQLDAARSYAEQIKRELAGTADGQYAHQQALQAQQSALNKFLTSLNEFKASIMIGAEGDSAPDLPYGAATLSPREREVLTLIAAGKTSREISEHLGIAFKTVICHRYRLQTKLRAHHTADLTRTAIRMGLAAP